MQSERTNEISVFVDESGSFEPDEVSSRFYLICFVLHDQSVDISPLVANLESDLVARSRGHLAPYRGFWYTTQRQRQ